MAISNNELRDLIIERDIRDRFGLGASQEHEKDSNEKRDFDPNNPGREQFDLRKDGLPPTASGIPPLASTPTPVDIPTENPFQIKIDLEDAVNFIDRWEGAKAADMKSAFAEAHLKNIAIEKYLEELKMRVQAAKQYGQSQIALPPIPYNMVSEIKQRSEDDEEYKKLASAFGPLLAVQKLFKMEDQPAQQQEKATDIVNSIVNAADKLRGGSAGSESNPAEIAKSIVDAAKELTAARNGDGTEKPSELVKSILESAKTIAELSSQKPVANVNPSNEQPQPENTIDTAIKLFELVQKSMSLKDASSTIRIPTEDGSIEEVPLQQYLLTELLKLKLNPGGQEKKAENNQSELVEIQSPDGVIKRIPATAYAYELAMKVLNEQKEKKKSNESQDQKPGISENSKLLSALVATVERLSNNMSALENKLRGYENPATLIDNLIKESEKWEQFRRRFIGSGKSEEALEKEKEEERKHQLELEKIKARKAQAEAFARAIGSTQHQQQKHEPPEPDAGTSIQNKEVLDELLERSRHQSEMFLQSALRDDVLSHFAQPKESGNSKKRGKKKEEK